MDSVWTAEAGYRPVRLLAFLRLTVLVFAAADLLALLYDVPPEPWLGTYAMGAVLAYAVASLTSPAGPRWYRRVALVGLWALTAAVWLVDARGSGFGWPMVVFQPESGALGIARSGLLVLAGTAFAAALLGAGGRSRRAVIVLLARILFVAVLAVVPLSVILATAADSWRTPSGVSAKLPLITSVLLVAILSGCLLARRGMRRAAGVLLAALTGTTLVGAYVDALSLPRSAGPRTQVHDALLWQGSSVVSGQTIESYAYAYSNPDYAYALSTAVGVSPNIGYPVAAHLPHSEQDLWAAGFSWTASIPAILAALCLIAVLAAVRALIPPGEHWWSPD